MVPPVDFIPIVISVLAVTVQMSKRCKIKNKKSDCGATNTRDTKTRGYLLDNANFFCFSFVRLRYLYAPIKNT